MATIDDAGLVRAPRWLVHSWLCDVAGWSRWWPRLVSLQGGPPTTVHHVQMASTRPWRPTRHLRVAVQAWGHRPGLGVHLHVVGDVSASVEFWLEDVSQGTVVHHLARVRRSSARAEHWRPAVRSALWALDERLVDEVRRAVLPTGSGGGPGASGTP